MSKTDQKTSDVVEATEEGSQAELDLGTQNVALLSPSTGSLLVAPKVIMASALFTARNQKQPRKFIKHQLLAVAPGLGEIKYRGEELRVYDDRKVWQAIIEMAREHRIHNTDFTLSTTVYQILKKVGWSSGGREYTHLKECLERLKATALTACSASGSEIRSVSLISKFVISDANQSKSAHIEVSLDPEIYKLFQRNDVALLSVDIMRGMPLLAHKIYEIIKANTAQHLSVSDYMRLSGSDYKHLRQFKAKLKIALEYLKGGSYIKEWQIDTNDIVTVSVQIDSCSE